MILFLILRAVDIEQLVEEDHEVRAIWELVGLLDLSRYYEDIKALEGVAGREPIDPRLLINETDEFENRSLTIERKHFGKYSLCSEFY